GMADGAIVRSQTRHLLQQYRPARLHGTSRRCQPRQTAQGETSMREYTPENITDAVLEQMSTTPDPRMKEIMESAVRHLHAFARDVKLTPAEWIMGIEFMTKVGQLCSPARQEFILLSDTLGLSKVIDVMHDRTKSEDTTGASLLGPFFRESTPVF